MRLRTRRVALCGLLLALTLVLGYVESQIPVAPTIPGVKLGLSNGVLIFAVYMLNIPTAFVLMALKVVLSGLMFSGFNAIPYGLAGGLLSLCVMAGLSRVKGLHPVVVSMAGGLMHNVGQVALAMVVLGTPSLMYYMAILMAVGLATGTVTGVAAANVMRHLKNLR